MMNKIKILANIFSKITVCVLLASAIYITVMCGLDAQISVMILWQILLVSAVCSIPILMYPDEEGKEVSKQGMIARQIIYLSMLIVLSWDLAEHSDGFTSAKLKWSC